MSEGKQSVGTPTAWRRIQQWVGQAQPGQEAAPPAALRAWREQVAAFARQPLEPSVYRSVEDARHAIGKAGREFARDVALQRQRSADAMQAQASVAFEQVRVTMARVAGAWQVAYSVLPLGAEQSSHARAASGAELAATDADAEHAVPPVAPRIRIIVNPASGTVQRVGGIDELEAAVQWLGEHGMPAELCHTERPGHAVQLAQEAVKAGMDMVVAAGGDGTVNDVIQALAGHTTALGVVPLGTVNVWAREMGIPLTTAAACEVLLDGIHREVDLGRAGSRYFLLMAGIGLDAEITQRVEKQWLKRIGLKFLDYLATAGLLSVTQKPARVTMYCDGTRRTVSTLMILIGNTRLYGGALTFAKRAVADDGQLDVVVVTGGGAMRRLSVFVRAALRRASIGPHARYDRCRTLRLESRTPVPVQVDGEVIGTLPMTFSVMPRAMRVIVPRDAPTELFIRPPLQPLRG